MCCEAYSGCSFYFLCNLIKNFLVKALFKIAFEPQLTVFHKCLSNFYQIQLQASYRQDSYEKKHFPVQGGRV